MKLKYLFLKLCIAPVLLAVLSLVSCKKFVDIPVPKDQIVSENAFMDDATATSAIIGIYSEMMNNASLFSSAQTTLLAGLAADELLYYTPGFRDEFSSNQISLAGHTYLSSYFWQPAYRFIYAANLCIQGLEKSQTITPVVKTQLAGEARFIRAFCLFYLSNLFGDIPLTISTDYKSNMQLPRSPQAAITAQVIADLEAAKQQLPPVYITAERARPNKWTAAALLARVYLYNQQWDKAEAEATAIIQAGDYALSTNLTAVFQKASPETIWQLAPVNPVVNTWEGNLILPALSSTQPTFLLTNELKNAFEPGDFRRNAWVASRTYLGQSLLYPSKYKIVGNNAPQNEYYVVFRLAEQYLIRAEARVHQNNISAAAADIDKIRNRASLPNTNANSALALQNAIEQERRIELMYEWGHRWLDLKRTGRADAVFGSVKPSTWQSTDKLWPIPNDQILLNNQLTQNPGY